MTANVTPMSDAILEAHRGRRLLDMLSLTGNDAVLADMLAAIGLAISGSALDALLDRLEAAGLISTNKVDLAPGIAARVSRLTRVGDDVRRGRASCQWIAPLQSAETQGGKDQPND